MSNAAFDSLHGYSEANFGQMASDRDPRIDQLRHVAVSAYLAGQREAGVNAPSLPHPGEIDRIISENTL